MSSGADRGSPVYDVIVIGAGHNGLTCAAYLARRGLHVLVLESRPIVGGFATTEETVADAPGFRMNACAIDTALTNVPRSVVTELGLAAHRLRFVRPDPWGAYVDPDGAAIAFWRDLGRTVAEIRRFSVRDAERFEALYTQIVHVWEAIVPYLQDHPTRPRPRTIAEVLWRVARHHRSLRRSARFILAPPEQLLEEQFEREEIKAFLANWAAWSMFPLQEPASSGVLLQVGSFFKWGVTRPVGGCGSLTGALADCLRSHGGEVRTDAPVAEVIVRHGVAEGVALASGDELYARQVVGAVDPTTLVRDLVPESWIPRNVQDEVRAMRHFAWNIAVAKSDVALSRRPSLACGRDELWAGYLLLGPSMDYIRRAQHDAMQGRLPSEVPMGVVMPSRLDRTLVPPGSDGESLYVFLPAVPRELSDGRDWADAKGAYHEHVVDVIDGYAPRLRASVIGSYVKTPKELAEQSFKGNFLHADTTLSQLGPWRPTPSLSGYRTPVAGLWHTGAGAHPVGGLCGWSGRTTARLVAHGLATTTRSRVSEPGTPLPAALAGA